MPKAKGKGKAKAEAKALAEAAKAQAEERAKKVAATIEAAKVKAGAEVAAQKKALDELLAKPKHQVTVEHTMFKLSLGKCCRIAEAIDEEKVMASFDGEFRQRQILKNLLTPVSALQPPLMLKSLERTSHATKQALLMSGGFWYPQEFDIEEFGPKKEYGLDEHISLYWALLQWSFGLDPVRLLYHQPRVTNAFLALHALDEEARSGEEQEEYKRTLAYFGKALATAEVHLLPVHSQKPCIHHALLVVDKSQDQPVVRYYDGLNVMHAGCKANAEALLQVVLPAHAEELSRTNQARQTGAQCTLFMCHYLEEECRHFRGEGFGSQGWPDQGRINAPCKRAGQPRSVRATLHALSVGLEQTRKKWAENEKKEESEHAELVLSRLHEKAVGDANIAAAQAAATEDEECAQILEALRETHSLPGEVPLPEDFPKKPEKPMAKAAPQASLPDEPAAEDEAVSAPKNAEEEAAPPLPPPPEAPVKDYGIFENLEMTADELFDHIENETYKAKCLYVKAKGLGKCGKCRYKSGCDMCDYEKCVRWSLRRENKLAKHRKLRSEVQTLA